MTSMAAIKEGERVFTGACRIIAAVNRNLIDKARAESDGTAQSELRAQTRAKAVHDTCTEIIERFKDSIDKGEL